MGIYTVIILGFSLYFPHGIVMLEWIKYFYLLKTDEMIFDLKEKNFIIFNCLWINL